MKSIGIILIVIGAIVVTSSLMMVFKNFNSDSDSDNDDLKLLLDNSKAFMKFIGIICIIIGIILLIIGG